MAERRPEQRPDANQQVVDDLREAADLLEEQDANPFRVQAYRRAADTVAGLGVDLRAIVREKGAEGLEDLPHIGRGIASAIVQIVRDGRWGQLDRLRGEVSPERLFRSIPGVGPELAAALHDSLEAETLEQLETAAHDGRLEAVPGVGERRAQMIRDALAQRLSRRAPRGRAPSHEPSAAELLDVDAEYREKAKAGTLRTIAPRRFNPDGEAWLPILHTRRGDWEFTALYSNTARAHDLDRVGDWVVIYFHTDHEPEGQRTVVTEGRGAMAGRRAVRGREAECADHVREDGNGDR